CPPSPPATARPRRNEVKAGRSWNGFLSFNYKDAAPPGLELHAFRLLPQCGLPPSLRFGAASRRDESARQGTPTPINSASASTRQGRCREQATQRRNRKTSNIELLPRPPSLRRWAFDARSRFIGVGCSMFPCIRAFAPAPWPKFF